jgi:hypothetical protein
MPPTISIYILGLKNSFRGEALLKELSSNFGDVHIHWGTDARLNPLDVSHRNDVRSRRIYGRVLRDSEIACAQGHFQILLKAQRRNTDIVLILEDDAEIVNIGELKFWITQLNLKKPTIWTFSNSSSSKLVIPSPSRKISKRTFCTPTLAHAYAINRLALDFILDGYARYGIEGFQADFPLFYADLANFEIAPLNIIQQSSVESIIGERPADKKTQFGTNLVRSILVFSLINWFLKGYQDSKIRGYLFFYHGRKIHQYIALLHRQSNSSNRSLG